MDYNIPKVAEIYPVGDNGLKPVPEYLKINKLFDRPELHLYNPFDSGLSIKTVPLQKVTFKMIAQSIILDEPELIERSNRGGENLEMFNQIGSMGNSLWPAASEIYRRLIGMPKRDDGSRLNITPDIGIIVNKPKRKIDSPKMVNRPAPPSAGGR